MPLEIRDEWLVALGKAASFLRHQATNEPNVKAIVADEYRSVAATLTDLENNLLGDRGRQAEAVSASGYKCPMCKGTGRYSVSVHDVEEFYRDDPPVAPGASGGMAESPEAK